MGQKSGMSTRRPFSVAVAIITSPRPRQVHFGSLQRRPVKWFGLELASGSTGFAYWSTEVLTWKGLRQEERLSAAESTAWVLLRSRLLCFMFVLRTVTANPHQCSFTNATLRDRWRFGDCLLECTPLLCPGRPHICLLYVSPLKTVSGARYSP